MKKIINGKKYDTDTARKLATHGNNRARSDFSYYEETLYIKKTGEYFIYGEGGPMSKYSQSCGQNCWSGGVEIVPLSVDEAKEWVEGYGDGDEYESIFGEVEE